MTGVRARRQNPPRDTGERVVAAIGLGIAVTSAGLALANILRRPSVSVAFAVLGTGLMVVYMPWKELRD